LDIVEVTQVPCCDGNGTLTRSTQCPSDKIAIYGLREHPAGEAEVRPVV